MRACSSEMRIINNIMLFRYLVGHAIKPRARFPVRCASVTDKLSLFGVCWAGECLVCVDITKNIDVEKKDFSVAA